MSFYFLKLWNLIRRRINSTNYKSRLTFALFITRILLKSHILIIITSPDIMMNNSNDSITNPFAKATYLFPDDGDGSVSDDSSTDTNTKNFLLREQDRFLPICNIVKIMKKAIPPNGKIAKDARECIQECVSEFISFITSEAIDRSHSENRKTVNGDDLLYAMQTLGFDNYVDPLTVYLHKYRESTKSDRNLVYNDPIYYEDSSNEFKQENAEPEILHTFTTDDPIIYCQTNQNENFNL